MSGLLQKLFRFNGGVKPDYHKEASNGLPITPAPLPRELVIPLHQSIGGMPRPLVAAGDSQSDAAGGAGDEGSFSFKHNILRCHVWHYGMLR